MARCVCRLQKSPLGKGCGKPQETCFQFGSHAKLCEKDMARFVTQEEALDIIDKCEEAAWSLNLCQPGPGALCNCCGDCCEILRSIKLHPKPAEKVLNNYYAAVDPDVCSACETCVCRCQMQAIMVETATRRLISTDASVADCASPRVHHKPCLCNAKPEPELREPPATAETFLMQVSYLREDLWFH